MQEKLAEEHYRVDVGFDLQAALQRVDEAFPDDSSPSPSMLGLCRSTVAANLEVLSRGGSLSRHEMEAALMVLRRVDPDVFGPLLNDHLGMPSHVPDVAANTDGFDVLDIKSASDALIKNASEGAYMSQITVLGRMRSKLASGVAKILIGAGVLAGSVGAIKGFESVASSSATYIESNEGSPLFTPDQLEGSDVAQVFEDNIGRLAEEMKLSFVNTLSEMREHSDDFTADQVDFFENYLAEDVIKRNFEGLFTKMHRLYANDKAFLFRVLTEPVPAVYVKNLEESSGLCLPKENVILLAANIADSGPERGYILGEVMLHELFHYYQGGMKRKSPGKVFIEGETERRTRAFVRKNYHDAYENLTFRAYLMDLFARDEVRELYNLGYGHVEKALYNVLEKPEDEGAKEMLKNHLYAFITGHSTSDLFADHGYADVLNGVINNLEVADWNVKFTQIFSAMLVENGRMDVESYESIYSKEIEPKIDDLPGFDEELHEAIMSGDKDRINELIEFYVNKAPAGELNVPHEFAEKFFTSIDVKHRIEFILLLVLLTLGTFSIASAWWDILGRNNLFKKLFGAKISEEDVLKFVRDLTACQFDKSKIKLLNGRLLDLALGALAGVFLLSSFDENSSAQLKSLLRFDPIPVNFFSLAAIAGIYAYVRRVHNDLRLTDQNSPDALEEFSPTIVNTIAKLVKRKKNADLHADRVDPRADDRRSLVSGPEDDAVDRSWAGERVSKWELCITEFKGSSIDYVSDIGPGLSLIRDGGGDFYLYKDNDRLPAYFPEYLFNHRGLARVQCSDESGILFNVIGPGGTLFPVTSNVFSLCKPDHYYDDGREVKPYFSIPDFLNAQFGEEDFDLDKLYLRGRAFGSIFTTYGFGVDVVKPRFSTSEPESSSNVDGVAHLSFDFQPDRGLIMLVKNPENEVIEIETNFTRGAFLETHRIVTAIEQDAMRSFQVQHWVNKGFLDESKLAVQGFADELRNHSVLALLFDGFHETYERASDKDWISVRIEASQSFRSDIAPGRNSVSDNLHGDVVTRKFFDTGNEVEELTWRNGREALSLRAVDWRSTARKDRGLVYRRYGFESKERDTKKRTIIVYGLALAHKAEADKLIEVLYDTARRKESLDIVIVGHAEHEVEKFSVKNIKAGDVIDVFQTIVNTAESQLIIRPWIRSGYELNVDAKKRTANYYDGIKDFKVANDMSSPELICTEKIPSNLLQNRQIVMIGCVFGSKESAELAQQSSD